MFKVIIDKLFPFVKTHSFFCYPLPILGRKVPLKIIENCSNHAKAKNTACHFWVTPKVCFIFS